MVVKALRLGLGYIIVFFSFLTRPKKTKRSDEQQMEVDQQAASLSLYQFYACPFCVKVRRSLRRLNMPVVTVNAQQQENREALMHGGGRVKVPCLKIVENGEEKWLYESKEIISYLEKRCA
ncbi:MAG: glutaredoxin [Pseudohongiellaceae bacterium]